MLGCTVWRVKWSAMRERKSINSSARRDQAIIVAMAVLLAAWHLQKRKDRGAVVEKEKLCATLFLAQKFRADNDLSPSLISTFTGSSHLVFDNHTYFPKQYFFHQKKLCVLGIPCPCSIRSWIYSFFRDPPRLVRQLLVTSPMERLLLFT